MPLDPCKRPPSKKALTREQEKLSALTCQSWTALEQAKAEAAAEAAKLKALKAAPPRPSTQKEDLMKWIGSMNYSRQLSFIPRDFSDGVLVAETIKQFLPEVVDVHNYISACGRKNKVYNWDTLNRKVFSQLGFRLPDHLIDQLVAAKRIPMSGKSKSKSNSMSVRNLQLYPIDKLREKMGEINPAVYNYRKQSRSDGQSHQDPFMKKVKKRVYRPMSRQPMSAPMWKIEKDSGAKYGEYKGNPIVWDALEDCAEDLEFASIGIAKQKYLKIKNEFWAGRAREMQNIAGESASSVGIGQDRREREIVETKANVSARPRSRSCCSQRSEESFKASNESDSISNRNPGIAEMLQKYQIPERISRQSSCSKIARKDIPAGIPEIPAWNPSTPTVFFEMNEDSPTFQTRVVL